MAFLDLDAPPAFGTRQPGVTLRIHPEWMASPEATTPPPASRARRAAIAASALTVAVAVHLWSAAALGSQWLGLATTGIVAAMALSLLTGARR